MKKLKQLAWWFFLFLIATSIVEVFANAPPGLILFKKIISLVFAAFVLYHIDIPKLLFGIKNSTIDIGFLLMCFCFSFPILFVSLAEQGAVLQQTMLFVMSIQRNEFIASTFAVFLGSLIALVLSGYVCNLKLKKLASILSDKHLLLRFAGVYTLLLASYFFLVRFIIEWIVLALDSLIMALGAIVLVLASVAFHAKPTVQKIGNLAEEAYTSLISLFNKSKTVWLGLSGIIVLHILVDLAYFLFPYLVPRLAVPSLSPSLHLSVTTTLLQAQQSTLPIFSLLIIILNCLAIFLMLFLPMYYWYISRDELSPTVLGLYWGSLFVFATAPLFHFQRIADNSVPILGIDIQTISLPLQNIGWILLAGYMVLLWVIYYAKQKPKQVTFITILSLCGVVVFYAANYLLDTVQHLMFSITSIAVWPGSMLIKGVVMLCLGVFLLLSIILYPLAVIALMRKWMNMTKLSH